LLLAYIISRRLLQIYIWNQSICCRPNLRIFFKLQSSLPL
jgi:hypothetical protein